MHGTYTRSLRLTGTIEAGKAIWVWWQAKDSETQYEICLAGFFVSVTVGGFVTMLIVLAHKT